MMEATFPTNAIFLLPDCRVRQNESQLYRLVTGQAHSNAACTSWLLLIAGSSAEGLTLDDRWGHECSDVDYMILYGSALGVCVTQEHLPTNQHHSDNTSQSASSDYYGQSCLVYDPEGCPPAYTRLRVINPQGLMTHPYIDDGCMRECDGQQWLMPVPLN